MTGMEDLEGKTIFEGKSKTEKEFFIRHLKDGDALAMREYLNTISQERTFISFQGEQVTLKGEESFVVSQIQKIKEGKAVELLTFSKEQLIGVTNLDLGERTGRHIANLGISVAKEFRDEGIGSKLLELTIEEGKKNLIGLEIVKLTVFSNNDKAISLYKKFGFTEYGSFPKGVKLENGYVDHLEMYKPVKEL